MTFMTATTFNTALVRIKSANSLVAQAGKVNLSGRGGIKKIAVDYKHIYKSQPFIIIIIK